jgi:glycosyltransferase involved in cell wall biosynthesis
MGLNGKSYLIPNFINTKDFKAPSTEPLGQATGVVMICRLDPFKDPLTAVHAFKYIFEKEPKATLQVIGDGPLYGPIKALIDELGLEKNVFLLGKHSDVRPYLWKNQIFLTGNAFLSVLEAWSAGLAVVATNEETTSKLITDGKNGVLVPPRDPQKLAEALLQLMRNSEYRLALAQNGVETASLYDVSVSAKQICNIYQSVIEKSA